MENIKEELRKVIEDVMLPETQEYLADLNESIENGTANPEDIEAKSDIEGFISELKTILEVIAQNKLSEEDAKDVYGKIITMISEHEQEN